MWRGREDNATLLSGRGGLVIFTRQPVCARPGHRLFIYLDGDSQIYGLGVGARSHSQDAWSVIARDVRGWITLGKATVVPVVAAVAINAVDVA